MDVKIFQTKNLGFVVTEVTSECKDYINVVNPRMLQMYVTPDKTGSKSLQIQLLPLVYKEVIGGDDYNTVIARTEFLEVTKKFDTQIIDMYIQVEGKVVEPTVEEEEESVIVDLFGNK